MADDQHTLNITISAKGSQAAREFAEVQRRITSLGSTVKSTFEGWKGLFMGAAGLYGFTSGVQNALKHAEEMLNMSRRFKTSVEDFSSLALVFETSGSNASGLNRTLMIMENLLKRVKNAGPGDKNPLAFLGMGLDEIKEKVPGSIDLLMLVADKWKEANERNDDLMKASIEQVLPTRMLGRFIQILNQGGDEVKRQMDEMRTKGLATTTQLAERADALSSAFTKLRAAVREKFFGEIGAGLAPHLERIAKFFTDSPLIGQWGQWLKKAVDRAFDIASLLLFQPKSWSPIMSYLGAEFNLLWAKMLSAMKKGIGELVEMATQEIGGRLGTVGKWLLEPKMSQDETNAVNKTVGLSAKLEKVHAENQARLKDVYGYSDEQLEKSDKLGKMEMLNTLRKHFHQQQGTHDADSWRAMEQDEEGRRALRKWGWGGGDTGDDLVAKLQRERDAAFKPVGAMLEGQAAQRETEERLEKEEKDRKRAEAAASRKVRAPASAETFGDYMDRERARAMGFLGRFTQWGDVQGDTGGFLDRASRDRSPKNPAVQRMLDLLEQSQRLSKDPSWSKTRGMKFVDDAIHWRELLKQMFPNDAKRQKMELTIHLKSSGGNTTATVPEGGEMEGSAPNPEDEP